MNLREHYKATLPTTPIKEADILGGIGRAAAAVGRTAKAAYNSDTVQNLSNIWGGKEGIKKALYVQAIHNLTGLNPDEVSGYYDKVKGTREGSLASKYLKALQAEGISDFSAVGEQVFVTAVEPTFKQLSNDQSFLLNNNIKLFALATYAVAKMYPSNVKTTSSNSKSYELNNTPLSMAEYFKFEAKVKSILGSKFIKYRIKFLSGGPDKLDMIYSDLLKVGGQGTDPDDFLGKIADTFLGLVFNNELLDPKYSNFNLTGITFTPGNLSNLYNVLATFINIPKSTTTQPAGGATTGNTPPATGTTAPVGTTTP